MNNLKLGPHSENLVSWLVRKGTFSHEDGERVITTSGQAGAPIEATVLELGMVEEEALYRGIAQFLEIPFVERNALDATEAENLGLSLDYLNRMNVAPVENGADHIMLATSSLDHDQTIADLSFHIGKEVRIAIAAPSAIRSVLEHTSNETIPASSISADDISRLKALAEDGPTVKRVDEILFRAVAKGASDIHFEAESNGARVRFRKDGVLALDCIISEDQKPLVISRLKVISGLNISERRRPQDGRVNIKVHGKPIDIRVSTLPTQFGESVVMRMLDKSRVKLNWKDLGFPDEQANEIRKLVSQPNGIFLVSGPTGSGKSTTLYTALSELDADARKIITVEDPIEYSLPGINQVQVNEAISLGFPQVLRAILRQDPDVVLVGEIRDEETAEIAVRAALVGRLVVSTIHTNSALSAVDRLRDLGVPAYLIAATLRGVLSQRLLRRVCNDCASAGCENCDRSGFSGRIVASELLTFGNELTKLVGKGATSTELEPIARGHGFTCAQSYAQLLAEAGIVSPKEIVSAFGANLYID